MRDVRLILQTNDVDDYIPALNKEIVRHLFLAGKPVEEHPSIFLEIMAELIQ